MATIPQSDPRIARVIGKTADGSRVLLPIITVKRTGEREVEVWVTLDADEQLNEALAKIERLNAALVGYGAEIALLSKRIADTIAAPAPRAPETEPPGDRHA